MLLLVSFKRALGCVYQLTVLIQLQSAHSLAPLEVPKLVLYALARDDNISIAHGLRNRPGMTPEKLHAWQTASQYSVSGVHSRLNKPVANMLF